MRRDSILTVVLILISSVSFSATKTYEYNDRDQVVSITSDDAPSNPITFTYDGAGNRKTKTHNGVLTEYEWSPRGNLIEVVRNGNWFARYQYDFLNRRISKEIREIGKNSVKTLYVYDGYENHLLAETNVLGNTLVKYHWANGRAIGESRNGQNYFYFHDALGSIVAVTAQDGSVVARIQYDAFGNVTATAGSHTGLFGFTGYYADDETGLLYAHNRYYDAELGAFISEDSFEGDLQDPPTLHGFLYAKANPTKYIDPDGRCNMGYMDYTSLLSCEDHYKEISELTAEQRLADQKLINDVQIGGFKGVSQAAGEIVVGAAQTAKDVGGAYIEAVTGGRVAEGSMLRLRGQIDATINFVKNPAHSIKTAVRNHDLIVAEMEARGDFEGAAQERSRFATTGLLAVAGGGASGVALRNSMARSNPPPRGPPPVDPPPFNGNVLDDFTGIVGEGSTNKVSINPVKNPNALLDTGLAHLPDPVSKINNRIPVNSKYAGAAFPLDKLSSELQQKYPNSVPFTNTGFPDFSAYAVHSVKVSDLQGNHTGDFKKANAQAGLKATPEGYTWHHHEDTQTMLLVPKDIHDAVKHTGGVAIIKQRNKLLNQ